MRRGLLVIASLVGCGEAVDTTPRDAGTEPTVAAHADTVTGAVKCVMQEGGAAAGNCQGLEIVESSVSMVPGSPAMATVISVVGFTDTLVSMSITNSDGSFQLLGPGCSGLVCDFSATPLALPYTASFVCNASDGQMHTATLVALGAQGDVDTDSAMLVCMGGGATPTITLSATMLSATAPVHQTSNGVPLTITNNGSAPLTFSLIFASAEWTSMTGCVAPASCTVPMGGGAMTMDLRFTPDAFGTTSSFLTVDSNAGMPTVSLDGTGVGAVLSVDDPPGPSFEVDFGTIGRGAAAARTISLSETGNTGIMVNLGAPGAPFTLSDTVVNLAQGGTGAVTVTCQSAAAIPRTTRTIAISSTAYQANTASITVHCEVANTQIEVTPTVFDFMEHRKGDAAPTIPIKIHNPGPLPANIAYVRLASGAPAALQLSQVPTGPLAPGGDLDGTLTLRTDAELDVAGAHLEIGVDDQALDYPITGKVVVPKAEVVPAQLELGTACIGTSVSGPVMMVNTGSARLTMQRPTMDAGFVPMFQSPTSYPAPLIAGASATVAVSPATQAVGPAEGSLTWDVDAPGAPFTIPVHLEYIDNGTAVSPGRLDFGRLDVDTESMPSTITLQNCNAAPITITVDGVVSQRGAVDAWDLQPRFDQRTLAPHDKMTISAAFAPRRAGSYHGQIKLDVDGEARFVDLLGEGIGVLPGNTSFYACSIGSGGGGTLVWPVPAALVIVLRRRRPAKA